MPSVPCASLRCVVGQAPAPVLPLCSLVPQPVSCGGTLAEPFPACEVGGSGVCDLTWCLLPGPQSPPVVLWVGVGERETSSWEESGQGCPVWSARSVALAPRCFCSSLLAQAASQRIACPTLMRLGSAGWSGRAGGAGLVGGGGRGSPSAGAVSVSEALSHPPCRLLLSKVRRRWSGATWCRIAEEGKVVRLAVVGLVGLEFKVNSRSGRVGGGPRFYPLCVQPASWSSV